MDRRTLHTLGSDCLISLQRQSASDRESIWVFVLNSSGPKGSISEKITKKPSNQRAMSGKANTGLHPSEQVRQRPGQPFAWHDEGTEKSRHQNWMEMVPFRSLIKLIFDIVNIFCEMVAGMELG